MSRISTNIHGITGIRVDGANGRHRCIRLCIDREEVGDGIDVTLFFSGATHFRMACALLQVKEVENATG